MIPRGFFYKNMFLFLICFSKSKFTIWILAFYLSIGYYYKINDGSVYMAFVTIYLFLFTIPFFISDSLNKEFYRYKKYLILKRKRVKRSIHAKN